MGWDVRGVEVVALVSGSETSGFFTKVESICSATVKAEESGALKCFAANIAIGAVGRMFYPVRETGM